MNPVTWARNWARAWGIGLRAIGRYCWGTYTWAQCEADTARARRLVGRE